MNLALALAQIADAHAGEPAIFWGSEEISHGAVWQQTLSVARCLRDEYKIKPGDRVGIWLKNCPEFVAALFGILQAGAVVVPLNNFLKAPEVEFILADAGIDLLILDETMREGYDALRQVRPGLRGLFVETFAGFHFSQANENSCASASADLAVIIYTSGTTGHPKGAMLSHGNLLANVASCQRVLETVTEDRFVVVLPMFHSFMLTVGVILPLLTGGSMILVKSVHPVKNILAEIRQHHGTFLPAVPQFFRALTHGTASEDLPVRVCISGGAPLPGEVLKEFNQRFPMPLLEGYGLSEASPVVSFNPLHGPWKAGSIGVPIADVEMSVQNEAGDLLPPGETGEVCVRGANVMKGYWNQPDETALVLRQGWLLTGDLGHVDADGYYYITDRKKDMLLVNGINVYPREIEEVAYQFPGIKEVSVVGLPDARKGEIPLAFVAVREGAVVEEAALLNFLRSRLADYKIPRRIVFLPALPRNATGKILKTVLRDQAVALNSSPAHRGAQPFPS